MSAHEVTADVLVIGGGAAGVAAARAAHEAGATVAVVADGGGATSLGSGVVGLVPVIVLSRTLRSEHRSIDAELL